MTETASATLSGDPAAIAGKDGEIAACLDRLPEDRTRWLRHLGELLEDDRQSFIEQAIQVLSRDSLAAEPVKALLELLARRGCPDSILQGIYALDRIRFREILSRVHALDPRLHIRMAKRLMELLGQDDGACTEEILFLYDSVVQVNGTANLAGVLPLLKQARDPRLRARAARLGASQPNGRHLLELYREEADPRVRACIVESLWLDNQPVARIVFEEARRDLQPRVRAFGLMGLYQLGDPRALAAMAEMAQSPQALSRAVAHAALELLHEPRLEPWLVRLRSEYGGKAARPEPITPAVRHGHRPIRLTVPRVLRLPSGKLSVQISARLDEEVRLEPELRALDLRAWVDGQPVLNYALSRNTPRQRLGVAVVFPMSLRASTQTTLGIQAVLDLLASMPDGELRSAGFYRSGLFMRQAEQTGIPGEPAAPEAQVHPLHVPVISQDETRFAADVKDSSREENLAAEPGELVLAMLNRLKPLKSVAHICVVLNEAVKGPPGTEIVESLRQGCRESGCALHVIAVGRVSRAILAPWCAVSRLSGGFESQVATEDELPLGVRSWMLCFREAYCLEFDAPKALSSIRIQAVHPEGVGEVSVPIEADDNNQDPSAG